MLVIAAKLDASLLPRILITTTVLTCACACTNSNHSDNIKPEHTTNLDLYCLLGSLSIEECFTSESEFSVVKSPLEVSEDLLISIGKELSKTKGIPDHETKAISPNLAVSSFKWDAACGFTNYIDNIWDGADDSGLFPRTTVRSLRIQMSTPLLIGDDIAFVVADCTDCQNYFVTKVVVFEYREGWRVRSSYDIAFV